jgi:DNA-binding transcriptional regulator YhcF (GntR family)
MLEININANSQNPLFQQIVEQVKNLIISGQLKPGEQIPSVRELASWLQVNPSTVARAYYDLKSQGLVATSRRLGTIIVGIQGRKDAADSSAEGFDWSINNQILDSLAHNPRNVETAFTLHPAQWRVQRVS